MKKLDINNRRYLGSKYKLLNFIGRIVEENCTNVNSIVDIFGGTGVVANYFLRKNKEVYVNDLLKSNYNAYVAWFGNEKVDIFKIENIINNYNEIKNIKNSNYFADNFADTYFSKNDCLKIGFIREDIDNKYRQNKINDREKSILISSLIYSMDRIANTVGHYDAYRKLSHIEDRFYMYMLNVNESNNNKVHIYNDDSNKLIRGIKADLVYIDPPYNSRQYSDAYHLLENIVNWDKPEVYGVARKMNRDNLKSIYCTNKAVWGFKDLIENCNSRYILVSYNNTGNKANGRSNAKISDLEIKEILGKKGNVKVFEQDYNNFTTGKSISENHKERLFLCEVKSQKKTNQVEVLDNEKYVKSPLNYTGGKFKLLSQLENKFPRDINTFVDFFCGAANVSCNVKAKNIIAIDNQSCLINILKVFKNYEYMYIINKIDSIIEKYNLSNTYKYGYKYYNCDSSKGLGLYNKEKYIRLRNDYNKMYDSVEKDFMLLTLIIYGFNHQIRFNSKGIFNTPVGKRDFNSSIRKNLLNFSEKLAVKNIKFINNDYKNFNIDSLSKKDFCYFDPPYYLGDATYNENNGWNIEKEKELLEFINEVNYRSVKFALSNVIEHHGEKNQILIDWAIENKYNINYLNYNYKNSNYHLKDKSGNSVEVLITNY